MQFSLEKKLVLPQFSVIYLNLCLAAVGHNADDIAETIIMNGIKFRHPFNLDNLHVLNSQARIHRTHTS